MQYVRNPAKAAAAVDNGTGYAELQTSGNTGRSSRTKGGIKTKTETETLICNENRGNRTCERGGKIKQILCGKLNELV